MFSPIEPLSKDIICKCSHNEFRVIFVIHHGIQNKRVGKQNQIHGGRGLTVENSDKYVKLITGFIWLIFRSLLNVLLIVSCDIFDLYMSLFSLLYLTYVLKDILDLLI